MSAWYKVSVSASSDGAGADAGGSMAFDLFVVKATDGFTYLRIQMTGSSIGFDSDEEQQFMRFGILVGDQSGVDLFTPAGEHQSSAWNDSAAATLDQSIDTSVNIIAYAPTELQQRTGTYSKTTSSGWSVGGNIGGSAGGDGGGGSSGGGGGEAGGDAAAGAVVA